MISENCLLTSHTALLLPLELGLLNHRPLPPSALASLYMTRQQVQLPLLPPTPPPPIWPVPAGTYPMPVTGQTEETQWHRQPPNSKMLMSWNPSSAGDPVQASRTHDTQLHLKT